MMRMRRIGGDRPGRTTLLRQSSEAFIARALLAVLAIVSVMVVARRVGPSTYGLYATAVAVSTLLAAVPDLGTSMVVIRDAVGDQGQSEAISTFLYARLALILIVMAIGVPVVFVALPRAGQVAGIVGLLTLPLSGPSMAAPIGQILGQMREFRVGVLIQGVVTTAMNIVVVLAWRHPSAVLLVWTNVIGGLAGTIYSTIAYRQILRGLTRFTIGKVLKPLAGVGLLGLGATLATLYYQVDSLFVVQLAGAHQAGIYTAAYKLLGQTAIVSSAILTPITPILAREMASSGRISAGVQDCVIRIEAYGGFALLLLLLGLANVAVDVLLGPRFAQSTRVVIVLAEIRVWMLVSMVATNLVVFGSRLRSYVGITAIGLCVNVLMCIILIPRLGLWGGVWATIATELAVVGGYVFACRSCLSRAVGGHILRLVLGGGICVALMWYAVGLPLIPRVSSQAICVIAGCFCLLKAVKSIRQLGQLAAA